MRFTRRLSWPVAGAAVIWGLALAGSSVAQDAAQPSAQGGSDLDPGWQKFCSEDPESKKEVCVVTRQLRAATGQPIAAFTLRESEGKFQFVAAVPPGMQIRPGMQVEIDGASTQRATFTVCIPEFCFADADLPADYVASLKQGNQVTITSVSQNGQPVSFPLSLIGFTKTFDGEAMSIRDRQEAAGELQNELSRRATDARQELIRRQRELNSGGQ